jgi:Protein of unknown function (DUF4240)
MDDQRFWDIISRTCQGDWIVLAPEGENDDNWDEARWYRPLVNELKKLAPDDIVRFQRWFDDKMDALYTWDHWGAMHLLTGSESDNKFAFFRAWLVCMGKTVYEAALANPDTLAEIVDPAWEQEYSSGFTAPGLNALMELELPTDDMDKAYAAIQARDPPEISGQDWPSDIPPAMLKARYPRLAERVGLQ